MGMVPFVMSLIVSNTHCGSKKIPWIQDIVAMILTCVVWWLVQSRLEGVLIGALGASIGTIASCIAGFIAMALAMPAIYMILYAIPANAPRTPVVETPGHGGHGGHAHH